MKFFRKIVASFNPIDYEDLAAENVKSSFFYLAGIMLLAFVIMSLLFIPQALNISHTIDANLANFNSLKLSTDISQKSPLALGKEGDFVIDLNSNATDVQKGTLVTSSRVIQHSWLGTSVYDISGYSDIVAHKDFYKGLAYRLLALMLPSLLILGYLYFLVKFAVLILLVSFVALIIVRISRYEVSFKSILNSTVYASTAAILVEMFTMPFKIPIPYFRIEWMGYILSLVFLYLGIREIGFFEKKEKNRYAKRRQKGYIELD